MSDNPLIDQVDEKSAAPAVTPDNFEDWLSSQPDNVQKLYVERTSGLKSALDAERAKAKETAKQLKKLAELEQAEQARSEAEMSETDKLKAQNAKLQATLDGLKLSDLKRTIAAEIGLPDVLAARIQGADEETMRADAEQLKEALPAQDDPAKPKPKAKITPTNPASGQKTGETREETRSRIFGRGMDIFDPAAAAQHGGGVRDQSDNE